MIRIRCLWSGAAALLLIGGLAFAQRSPRESLQTLTTRDGVEVSLFASEPLVTNPAAIDVDTHGRVWVAEIQWYRGGAKNPPADKIKVLEDTDGDGRADKVTVFADNLFCPMSICVVGSKVYVATSPDLWVYEDLDGDLKADGPPKKLLTGFGGHNHDHGAHSLVLGPDHKWWMSHGDEGFDVTGVDGSRAAYTWGAVLRGELDGSKLETVAVNFRNPYEVCVSSFGEAFLSDNDNDGNQSTRICWIMDGGNYGWYGGPPFVLRDLDNRLPAELPFREHWHFRGHIPGHVPATLVTGFGSPCGIFFYEGDAFGPALKNAPLHADPGPRLCRVFGHRPAGFGMQATSEPLLSNQGDDYFRPDDICAAPDGRLYVSDWYDGGVGGHAYNNPDQGRIFVLTPQGKSLERREKPGPYETIEDAIVALASPTLATQYLARDRLLATPEESAPALVALLTDDEPNLRARALWLLDRIGGEARQSVLDHLRHDDVALRGLAVRILRRHGAAYGEQILALATDPAPSVRREVLLALPALQGGRVEQVIAELAAEYDGSDRYLLEAVNIAAAGRQAAVLARLEARGALAPAQFPLLQLLSPERAVEHLVRQLADARLDAQAAQSLLDGAVNIPALEAGWGLLRLAQDEARPAELRRAAFQRLLSNVDHRGHWHAMRDDERFAAAVGQLLDDDALRTLALRASGTLQLGALAAPVLAIAQRTELGAEDRAHAARVAARLKPAGVSEALRQLLDDDHQEVSRAALAGLIDLQDIRALREILCTDRFPLAMRQSTATRLADSVGGALVLLRLIDEQQLPANLTEEVVAKAVAHPDANVRVLYEKFVPADQRARKLGKAVSPEEILALAGDANRGRLIFFKSTAAQCSACHTVQGFGGATGPELTRIGAKYERAALLETILEPSKAIAPEYVPYLLETTGGQVFAGFLEERTDDYVVLKDIKNARVRVSSDEIEVLIAQQKSLMPELMLSEISAQDAADLLEFLCSLK